MARQAKVSRDEILAAALLIINEQGLDGLSMRKLGEALGVEAMTLYNWVGNKEELLSALHGRILASVEIPERSSNWRRDIETAAQNLRRSLSAHPRALGLFLSRPAVSNAPLKYVEWTLGVLRVPIPQDLDRVYALQSLLSFVVGQTALQCANHSELELDYSAPVASEYPELAALSSCWKSYSPEVEFGLGLGALLEAIERRHPF